MPKASNIRCIAQPLFPRWLTISEKLDVVLGWEPSFPECPSPARLRGVHSSRNTSVALGREKTQPVVEISRTTVLPGFQEDPTSCFSHLQVNPDQDSAGLRAEARRGARPDGMSCTFLLSFWCSFGIISTKNAFSNSGRWNKYGVTQINYLSMLPLQNSPQ